MSLRKAIDAGLKFAADDFKKISMLGSFDVKPKEDQVKCCLYKSLTEFGYTVHVEASYARNGGRCDLIAIEPNSGARAAIEIKTAWAGGGWVNKPKEQMASWRKDIVKLMTLQTNECVEAGILVICFAYERESEWQVKVRNEIDALGGTCLPPFELSAWNRLNEAQFFVIEAFTR